MAEAAGSRQAPAKASAIASKSRHAVTLFNNLTSTLTSNTYISHSTVDDDDIKDELGRFRIWAGNIGALRQLPSRTSLDHRLRNAPKTASQVLEVLGDLNEALEDLFTIVNGVRQNRSASIPSPEYEAIASNEAPEHLETTLKLDESKELLLTARESITALFRISILIRKKTPRDRYAQALATVREPLDETFDVNHVSEKFLRLSTPETAWLKQRLGQAITHRREFLRYCQEHHLRAASEPSSEQPPNDGIDELQNPSVAAPTTSASTFFEDIPELDAELPDDRSQTTFATFVADEDEGDIDRIVSLREVTEGRDGLPFECPYCKRIQDIDKERDWRKHVLSDLKPYVCTFRGCDTKLFSDRHDWFDHELKEHRVQWSCRFCNEEPFKSRSRFEHHVRDKHVQSIKEDQLAHILEISRAPVQGIPAADCPFCFDFESKLREDNPSIHPSEIIVVTNAQFRRHVGSHMQRLALFAIAPRTSSHDSGDEDDTKTEHTEISNENLNPRYMRGYTRVSSRHITNFFCPGRVFSMLWAQPARPDASTRALHHFNTEYSVRKYVVISNRGHFSQCLRVQTYQRRGFNTSDYAIIYIGDEGDDPLESLFGEYIMRKPFRVVKSTPDSFLDPASRINFSEVYTVRHDVRVRDIGVIAPEDIPLLVSINGVR